MRFRSAMLLGLGLVLAALAPLVGCGAGDSSESNATTEASTNESTTTGATTSGGGSSPDASAGGVGDCESGFTARCPSPRPSYQKTIAPIVEAHCHRCHFDGNDDDAPLLDGYAAFAANSIQVASDVASCMMPADGERLPTDEQRQAILDWIACGTPEN